MNILLRMLFSMVPSDRFAHRYPVSIKGVLVINGKVVLLKNERDEWELPGGKIEPGESPEQCLVREIGEELHLDVSVRTILESWIYRIRDRVDVFITAYLCEPLTVEDEHLRKSHEHKDVMLFAYEDIKSLNMPIGYKSAIEKAGKIIGIN